MGEREVPISTLNGAWGVGGRVGERERLANQNVTLAMRNVCKM